MAENDEENCPVCGGDLDDGICEDCGYDTADDDDEE